MKETADWIDPADTHIVAIVGSQGEAGRQAKLERSSGGADGSGDAPWGVLARE